MELYVGGARGTFPCFGDKYEKYGNDTSCYLIKDGDYALILDCGSGLLNVLPLISDCKKIDVLLTHVHYDHIMGLFDVGRESFSGKVDFYGKFSKWEKTGENATFKIDEIIPFEKHDIELEKTFELGKGFYITFVPSNHGDDASMIDIKKDGKHIFYTGDYEYNDEVSISPYIKDCDLLLFDGSYSSDDYIMHKGWGHSSREIGCNIAKENNVKKLLIIHHAPEYSDDLLDEAFDKAKEIYINTEFAEEGVNYEI